MHILHVIPGDLWAGAEAQFFYTIKGIKRRANYKITVVLFNKLELYRRLLKENVKVVVFDEKKRNGFQLLIDIARLLNECEVDIIHTHEYKGHILSLLAKKLVGEKCCLIRTLHGRTAIPQSLRSFKSYLALKFERILLYYFTENIVAVSNDLEIELKRTFKRANIHKINNGIPTEGIVPSVNNEVRKTFGIKEGEFWVGTAARLVSVKNIDMLIDSAKLLTEKNPDIDFKVSIFGDGEMREQLEQKIKRYSLEDRVLLHGHYSNMYPVFKSLDVFTLTSLDEGLPISLLEAMSMGAIPVCTKVGGMKEVIKHGENGFLVSSGNVQELVLILTYIYENKDRMQPLRENAKRTVEEYYSIDSSVEELLRFYKSLKFGKNFQATKQY